MKRKTAVALQYDRRLPAPLVVARGKGELARRLETIARENGVPVVETDELAESLHALEPGTCIPESFYEVVAELLAFVWRAARPDAVKKVWDEEHQGE